MDILFDALGSEFELTVFYNKKKSAEKLWKKQEFYDGTFIPTISLYALLRSLFQRDFVIVSGWSSRVNVMIIFYLIIIRKPFAIFSDVPDDQNITPTKTFLKKMFFRFIPYLFVTGKTGVEHFRKFYNVPEKKMRIFPYTVRIPTSGEIDEINRHRNEALLLKKDEKIRIFIANRFIERKGYKTLLRAFERLKKNGCLENFSIKIAGSGEQYERYVEAFGRISQQIELLHWIEVEHYKRLIKSMDVFIHASLFEPYGIPVLDVMGHGKLIIASDGVMSAVDLIENGTNGFLYHGSDDQELYTLLKKIHDRRAMIYEIGHNARKDSSRFAVYNHIECLKSLLRYG